MRRRGGCVGLCDCAQATGGDGGVWIEWGVTNEVNGTEMNTNEMVSCGGAGRAALVWNRPGGTSEDDSKRMTCAEVKKVDVWSSVCGASVKPPPFDGQMPHEFNVTHSPNPDQHAVVFFKDVVNDSGLAISNFSVRMALRVQPIRAPVGRADWFTFAPTPESGALVSVSEVDNRSPTAAYSNVNRRFYSPGLLYKEP